MHENWLCWLYQYGVGGMVFVGTLGLAVWSQMLRPDVREDRWLLGMLLSGMAAFAVGHALWITAVLR
jgi:hypothetical protein